MFKTFVILYLLVGLTMSFIYDYHVNKNITQVRTICQHLSYAVMWPFLFWYKMV